MGTIARFDLISLSAAYGLLHFVETGTGRGDGLAYAAASEARFRSLRSGEIEPALADAARRRLGVDPRVRIETAASAAFLQEACRAIPRDEPVLFWLDAHFPGADFGIRSAAETTDATMRLPLAEELGIIAAARPEGADVIVADDLRIYVDGPFAHGNLPANLRHLCPVRRDIGFVHALMGATHTVQELYEHEGYVLMLPKGTTV